MAGSGALSSCDAITASRAPTTIRTGQEARASVGPMESAGASSPNSDAASARRAAPPSRARAASAARTIAGGSAAGSATSAAIAAAIACGVTAAQNGSMNAARSAGASPAGANRNSDRASSAPPPASAAATAPPSECPARCSRPRSVANAAASTASSTAATISANPPATGAEAPWPGRSSANTGFGAAIRPTKARHAAISAPKPWISSSGSPVPSRNWRIETAPLGAGAATRGAACPTSARWMRPAGPEPTTFASVTPRSRARRRAAGVARIGPGAAAPMAVRSSPTARGRGPGAAAPMAVRFSPTARGREPGAAAPPSPRPSPPAGGRGGACGGGGASVPGVAAAGVAGSKTSPSAQIHATAVPTGIGVSSRASRPRITPASGASISIAALSVSISKIG